MSQEPINPNVRFLGRKVCSFVCRHESENRGPFSGFQEFLLQPMIKEFQQCKYYLWTLLVVVYIIIIFLY